MKSNDMELFNYEIVKKRIIKKLITEKQYVIYFIIILLLFDSDFFHALNKLITSESVFIICIKLMGIASIINSIIKCYKLEKNNNNEKYLKKILPLFSLTSMLTTMIVYVPWGIIYLTLNLFHIYPYEYHPLINAVLQLLKGIIFYEIMVFQYKSLLDMDDKNIGK